MAWWPFNKRNPGGNDWAAQLCKPGLKESQFTKIYRDAASTVAGVKRVSITGPLALTVRFEDGGSSTENLGNLWLLIRANPETALEEVKKRLRVLATTQDLIESSKLTLDLIIPTIKNEEYIRHSEAKIYREHLVSDLWVVYGFDLPESIMMLNEEEKIRLNVESKELRRRAISKLLKTIDEPQVHGEGPLKMIVCGGTFEASLLLVPQFWKTLAEVVPGRIVACVPNRDLLYVTGADDTAGLNHMRELADKMFDSGDHPISKTLIVRDGEDWKKFA